MSEVMVRVMVAMIMILGYDKVLHETYSVIKTILANYISSDKPFASICLEGILFLNRTRRKKYMCVTMYFIMHPVRSGMLRH